MISIIEGLCVPAGRRYRVMGADGFCLGDTCAALRQLFQVDAGGIGNAAKGCA